MTTKTYQRREPAKPTFYAYCVTDEKNAFWIKIGAAFAHDDGKGFSIPLHCLPVNGRVVLRVPEPDSATDTTTSSQPA